jgi:hypothetical protein
MRPPFLATSLAVGAMLSACGGSPSTSNALQPWEPAPSYYPAAPCGGYYACPAFVPIESAAFTVQLASSDAGTACVIVDSPEVIGSTTSIDDNGDLRLCLSAHGCVTCTPTSGAPSTTITFTGSGSGSGGSNCSTLSTCCGKISNSTESAGCDQVVSMNNDTDCAAALSTVYESLCK